MFSAGFNSGGVEGDGIGVMLSGTLRALEKRRRARRRPVNQTVPTLGVETQNPIADGPKSDIGKTGDIGKAPKAAAPVWRLPNNVTIAEDRHQ